MNTTTVDTTTPSIAWREIMDDAFEALVRASLRLISDAIQAKATDEAPPPVAVVDEEAAQATALLGVAPTASADQIRAALRTRLVESKLHPDHGGNADEAAELIAAKNLLIERLKP